MNHDTQKKITKSHLSNLDSWEQTAIEMAEGMEYYQEICKKSMGILFPAEGRISDDGSIQNEILVAKFEELSEKLIKAINDNDLKTIEHLIRRNL